MARPNEPNTLVYQGSLPVECTACGDVIVEIKDGIVQNHKEPLYNCSKCNKIFCEDCGVFHHRKNRKGHAFSTEDCKHVVSLTELLAKDVDSNEYGMGKKLIVALIGEEKYKKIQPWISGSKSLYTASLAGIVLLSDLINNAGLVKAGLREAGLHVSSSAAAAAGGIATAIIAGLEIAYAGYRWYKGEICGKEFVRLTGKIVVKSGAAFGGLALGAKIGAAIGTATVPGVGTAIGIVGGAILGFAFGWVAAKTYEWIFPNGEQAARKRNLEDALKYFHFNKKDLKNKKIFNKKELTRRYRQYALDAHPDRNDGDSSKWSVLSSHYGTLQAILEQQKSKVNKKIVEKVLAVKN